MNRRTKLAIARDKKLKSLHGGKRISADGNIYYEYRENRSDANRTKKFRKGGDLWTPLDFTSIEEYFDYINDSLINGNITQVKKLYNDMDESQKRQFFRYANMQEGMFDEVVDYINENVREYANGGRVGSKKFRKGDKVLTREGKIETVLRVNKNGNIETEENDYSWSPDSLKHAKGEYANGDGVSILQDKIDHINKTYDGVTASKTYSDNRIQVVSPYFNTLNDIKRNEFDGSGLLERYGNTTQYVLYSNKTYAKGGDVEDEFIVHGHYTVSNSGGYEIMLSDDGEAARVRDAFGSENPETSDWLDIEYIEDENGEPDEDGNLPSEPVIDTEGYNIPMNLVMRSNFKKGGNLKKTKYIVFYVSEEGQMRERVFEENEKESADDFAKKVNGSVSPIKLAKGGSVKQKGAQYKIDGYGSGDRKHKAKPVGFRYERIRDPKTGKLRVVTKEDKKYYATPTQKEIKAYKDGDVTARKMLGFEVRADHSDKEPVRFSRKFAKGGSVTIGEYKATFKVKYALDGGKLKDGYVVSVLTPSEHEVDYYNLYDSKKNLVKKLSPQEAQQLVKDKKITFVKRYDVPNEKQKSSPDTEVKDMSYAERREWIKENIVPNLKSAVNYWNSYNHGSFDSNDKKSEKEFLDKVRKSAMYGSTEEFEKATSLKVDDSGWGLQSPEGEEFEQVASDNTYNSSYLGLFDWNFRIYSIYDERFVLIAHPHMGGDVRGNYGDPIFLEGESKEDVLMKFYEEVIDGKHSVNLEFKDGTSVTFDAQQDSDVNYYELYDDGSKKKIKLGSPVEVLTTTFKTFGGWKGDDFVEEIVDEFERSKEKKAKKMSNGGGVDSSDNSNYAIIAYNKAKAGTTQNKGFYDAVSVAKTLNVGSDLGNNLIIVKGNLLWTNARVKGVELENGEKIYYGEYQHEYFTENQLDYLRSIMVEENGDNYNKFDFSKLNQMKNGGGIGHKFKVGDLVFNRTLGSRGLVGLVISEGKENEEYETFEYDVLYRGYGGDVIPTEESEIVDITEGYIDFAEGNGDLMHYPNIAKKHGITLNKKYQEAIDENSDEEEFARGGHVSKGELVWGKLSSSDKINFLHENFTPEITPRTQQTLVGKTFNFLPKNVKIKIESKYANVEDYAKGGGVNEPELLIDANRGIYVPQTFYERYDFKEFGLNKEDYTELSDPENEGYWDAWNDVVDTAETKDGKTLFEIEGNLFLADKYHDFDLLKKGGAIKQRGAQYERDIPYGGRDTSVRARPVGYRYRKIVDKKTGRLRTIEKTDKEYYKPVTQKDIQAYEEGDKSARRRIYKELRRDHSDKPSKNKRAY